MPKKRVNTCIMTLIVYFLCARDLFLLDMLLIKKQIRTKKEALNYE